VSADLEEVDHRAERLYDAAPRAMRGVLHVVAVGGDRRVMRIGPTTPKSPTDLFVLWLSRARVDAILVSGAVLRAEPELSYEMPALFRAHRRALGLSGTPRLAVLSGGDVPLGHPALAGRPIVLTSTPAAGRAWPPELDVVGLPAPSARAAIAHLAGLGYRSVSIEAGPRTAVPLYEPPLAIDELLLSVFEGPIDESLDAGAFLAEAELEARGLERLSQRRLAEPSGPWRFERWARTG
jgi:riboflavin biosynthesis pyrimidine reductase